MRGRVGLSMGLTLGACTALALLLLSETGAGLRVKAGPVIADLQHRFAGPASPAAHPQAPSRPASRVSVEDGRTVVRLSDDEQARIGVATVRFNRAPHRIEVQAYGSVLDLARVTELTNSYASAKAQLQTAEAKAAVSRNAFNRARNLGQYATQVQLETTEGTFRTDEAALTAAQSQVRTLAATAQQEWGTVIGRAIVERSGVITRLIERAEFLVQVTLPPGETLKAPPGIAVPESAVVHWQGRAWIYRSVGDDAFARHLLPIDAPISADSFVLDDLGDAAEIVVTGPQAVLSEEMKGQIQASGETDDD